MQQRTVGKKCWHLRVKDTYGGKQWSLFGLFYPCSNLQASHSLLNYCPKLKLLCKENATKTSGIKANIIGRLVTMWKAACDVSPKTCSTSAAATIVMPAFNELCSWMKDLLQLYHYLVNSKEKCFNETSMEAFKSLKVYQYFADSLITIA